MSEKLIFYYEFVHKKFRNIFLVCVFFAFFDLATLLRWKGGDINIIYRIKYLDCMNYEPRSLKYWSRYATTYYNSEKIGPRKMNNKTAKKVCGFRFYLNLAKWKETHIWVPFIDNQTLVNLSGIWAKNAWLKITHPFSWVFEKNSKGDDWGKKKRVQHKVGNCFPRLLLSFSL